MCRAIPGEKARQHGLGQQVRHPPQSQKAGQNQQDPDHDRQQGGRRAVGDRARRRQGGQSSGENGGDGEIGPGRQRRLEPKAAKPTEPATKASRPSCGANPPSRAWPSARNGDRRQGQAGRQIAADTPGRQGADGREWTPDRRFGR